MSDALTSGRMSPGLLEVVARARREPEGRFHALAHLIDVPALERAYHRMRPEAAVGVDGVTKERYGQDLERNRRGDVLSPGRQDWSPAAGSGRYWLGPPAATHSARHRSLASAMTR